MIMWKYMCIRVRILFWKDIDPIVYQTWKIYHLWENHKVNRQKKLMEKQQSSNKSNRHSFSETRLKKRVRCNKLEKIKIWKKNIIFFSKKNWIASLLRWAMYYAICWKVVVANRMFDRESNSRSKNLKVKIDLWEK